LILHRQIAPFLHDKLAALRDLEVKQLVKPFIKARQFQFPVRANDSLFRYQRFSAALTVAFKRGLQGRFEVIPGATEPGVLGLADVAGAPLAGQVGVVNHERLLGLQTSGQQNSLAVARPQHIHVDANVCVEESLLKEC
jgi:hypothetical protein